MKDYKAVVFDMDGVIFDSERAIMGCWIELADKYNLENIEKAFLSCTGTTAVRTREIMLETYGENFPYDEYAKESSRMFHERYDNGKLPIKSGVFELLNYLKKNGKKIALASSTRRESVINELRDANLIDYFDEIVTGDMVSKSKPAPDIFLKAVEKLGIEAKDAYAIEDSYNGIKSAYGGNLRPIMVPDLLPANAEMTQMSEVILPSLNDVITYLEL